MFLKCVLVSTFDTYNFVFDVYPTWTFRFMVDLAFRCLSRNFPAIPVAGVSLSFTKLPQYELSNDDTYVDLMHYVEEDIDAVLRDSRQ